MKQVYLIAVTLVTILGSAPVAHSGFGAVFGMSCRVNCKRLAKADTAIGLLPSGKALDERTDEEELECFCGADFTKCIQMKIVSEPGEPPRAEFDDVVTSNCKLRRESASSFNPQKGSANPDCAALCNYFGFGTEGLLTLNGSTTSLANAAEGAKGTCYCPKAKKCVDISAVFRKVGMGISPTAIPSDCSTQQAVSEAPRQQISTPGSGGARGAEAR